MTMQSYGAKKCKKCNLSTLVKFFCNFAIK